MKRICACLVLLSSAVLGHVVPDSNAEVLKGEASHFQPCKDENLLKSLLNSDVSSSDAPFSLTVTPETIQRSDCPEKQYTLELVSKDDSKTIKGFAILALSTNSPVGLFVSPSYRKTTLCMERTTDHEASKGMVQTNIHWSIPCDEMVHGIVFQYIIMDQDRKTYGPMKLDVTRHLNEGNNYKRLKRDAMSSIIAPLPSSRVGPTVSPSPSVTSTPQDPVLYIVIELNLALSAFNKLNPNTIVAELEEVSASITNSTLIWKVDKTSNETVTVLFLTFESVSDEPDNIAGTQVFDYLVHVLNNETDSLNIIPELSKFVISVYTLYIPPQPPTSPEKHNPVWLWVFIAIAVGITITALAIHFHICREYQREKVVQKTQNRRYTRLEEHMVHDEVDIGSEAKPTRTPRVPIHTNVLTMGDLEKIVSNPAAIYTEYDYVLSSIITKEVERSGVEEKNRHGDILPNPQTRVSLFLKFGVENSDYINANYITGYLDEPKAYIATQAPLEQTCSDFWRMVWEQKVFTIVMITDFEEDGEEKCFRYWRDEETTQRCSFDELAVTIKEKESTTDYTITTFQLKQKEKRMTREVTHLWFRAWPERSLPTNTDAVIDFIQQARKSNKESPGPVVVHCSNGIGRTGVFVAADIGMQQLEETGEVDVLGIVSFARQDRGGMVQTQEQYAYLHKILLDYSRSLRLKDSSEEASEVVTNTGAVLATDETAGEEEGMDNKGMESHESEEEGRGDAEDGSQETAEEGDKDSDNDN